MTDFAASGIGGLMAGIGLDHHPFPVTPDPDNYFLSPSRHGQIVEILHCVEARKGFLLITADVGLGKTTLSRRIIDALDQAGTRVALVFNSFLRGPDLLRALARDFGLDGQGSLPELLEALNGYLLAQYRQGHNCCIIVDDAQHLDLDSLELIRQLSNLETDRQKLVQIILIAQPEIGLALSRPEIRQLNSRISLHAVLSPYGPRETADYIRHRLRGAGNHQAVRLSAPAAWLIWRASRGYPRQINLIMDRCLYALAGTSRRRIGARLARRAVADLGRLKTRQSGVSGYVKLCAVALLAVAAAWYAGLPRPSLSLPGLARTTQVDSGTMTAAPASLPVREARPGSDIADPELQRFLAYYGLAHRYPAFARALATELPQRLDALLADTPWRRVTSASALPELDPAAVLHRTGAAGRDSWLFLWRPDYEISAFHYGAHSTGIQRLQQDLRLLGYYPETPDGVAGSLTKLALAEFQTRQGMVPTGEPDALTLYLLQHSAERGTRPAATAGSTIDEDTWQHDRNS